MPYPLPLTRTEAYLAYKAGVIQQSDLKPSLAVPRNGIDAWLAYWTGLAADYPKREDGTPHILQEEEAYIAYLCGVINEYPEKCLRRVGAYLRYLISARWGRPDHPLNREELYLSLIKTQFIPSGDPSSDIKIDGTAKAPFVDVKMYGDTTQQTYTGKNLFNIGWNKTASGGTNSVDFTTTNGSLEITQTGANGNGSVFVNLPESLLGKTLTLSVSSILLDGSSGARIRLTNQNGGDVSSVSWAFYPSDNNLSKTFSLPSELPTGVTYFRLYFYVNASNIQGSVGAKVGYNQIQIEEGSTATAYEQYVGGVPSPNPDYPQAVQTVTGEQTIDVVGKNLLDQGAYTSSSLRGASVTFNQDKIAVSGAVDSTHYPSWILYADGSTATSDWWATASLVDTSKGQFTDSGTYTISIEAEGNIGSIATAFEFIVGFMDGTISTNKYVDQTTKKATFTTSKPINYISFGFRPSVSYDATFTIQLEAGDTATSFAPYSKHTYPINLGKNLFDKSSATILDAFIDYSQSSMKISNYAGGRTTYIKCQPNTTYTVSKMLSARFVVATTSVVPANNVTINQYVVANDSTSATITTDGSANYLAVFYYNSSFDTSTPQQILDTLQFEEGSTATSYAPYFTPIELCKIGDYQDYIYKSGGKWYVRKETTSFVLDGTRGGFYSSWFYVSFSNLGITNVGGINLNAFSPDFKAYDYNTFVGDTTLNGMAQSGSNFIIRNIHYSDAAGYKDWLASSLPKVYYPLAAPTDTEITDQTLIAQLEALVNGGAENGTTYITVNATDPNLPGLLYVEAPKYE